MRPGRPGRRLRPGPRRPGHRARRPRGGGAHLRGAAGPRHDVRAEHRRAAMKYLDEYRDASLAEGLARRIAEAVTRPWVIMEVCGGQTHSIVRYGIDRMLPPQVELVQDRKSVV